MTAAVAVAELIWCCGGNAVTTIRLDFTFNFRNFRDLIVELCTSGPTFFEEIKEYEWKIDIGFRLSCLNPDAAIRIVGDSPRSLDGSSYSIRAIDLGSISCFLANCSCIVFWDHASIFGSTSLSSNLIWLSEDFENVCMPWDLLPHPALLIIRRNRARVIIDMEKRLSAIPTSWWLENSFKYQL